MPPVVLKYEFCYKNQRQNHVFLSLVRLLQCSVIHPPPPGRHDFNKAIDNPDNPDIDNPDMSSGLSMIRPS